MSANVKHQDALQVQCPVCGTIGSVNECGGGQFVCDECGSLMFGNELNYTSGKSGATSLHERYLNDPVCAGVHEASETISLISGEFFRNID